MWSLITFGIMVAVAITYNLTKGPRASHPQGSIPVQPTREYFISIDLNDAIALYSKAKESYDSMNYKEAISLSYSAVKDVLTKVLSSLQIPFSPELNIVDMSFLALSKGVKVSFIEATQHINTIKLRSTLDQPITKEEVLWMLSASKTIIDSCKELPLSF
ncbi:MAG: hypothetical protein QXJ17_02275 [Nitrososphaeria archaeon]